MYETKGRQQIEEKRTFFFLGQKRRYAQGGRWEKKREEKLGEMKKIKSYFNQSKWMKQSEDSNRLILFALVYRMF